MSKVRCNLCPHNCNLGEGQIGICRARSNSTGKIYPINYGKITGFALDPIEKKPLKRFYPGKNILSVGSFACNLSCDFCQNHNISMASINDLIVKELEPEELVEKALKLKDRDNIGLAYTYNEPLIGYEYVRDCAKLAKEKGLKNVLVTNGCFHIEPIKEIFSYIDAFNIDLKGFTNEFYNNIRGDLETVKRFIEYASRYGHVEITTLIIEGENDKEEEIMELSQFLSSIHPDIPLHISRFFPNYKMSDKNPTKVKKIYDLANIARENLRYVYEGNC